LNILLAKSGSILWLFCQGWQKERELGREVEFIGIAGKRVSCYTAKAGRIYACRQKERGKRVSP